VVYVELDEARRELRADNLDRACTALVRACEAQRALVESWNLLTTMTPGEFLEFRDALEQASGTQSFMYRSLEFLLGNKDPAAISACRDQIKIFEVLQSELNAPTLYDESLRMLSRRGLPLPDRVLNRDVSTQYQSDPDVERMWRMVYSDAASWPHEHRVAELLTDVSFRFSHWRAKHLLVVERMLGTKPGTGGTTGIAWLREVNAHRFFPELWSVRSTL
jgi:tryptophan 2,3-dioxygenase